MTGSGTGLAASSAVIAFDWQAEAVKIHGSFDELTKQTNTQRRKS
jgi:hypothetical protein